MDAGEEGKVKLKSKNAPKRSDIHPAHPTLLGYADAMPLSQAYQYRPLLPEDKYGGRNGSVSAWPACSSALAVVHIPSSVDPLTRAVTVVVDGGGRGERSMGTM